MYIIIGEDLIPRAMRGHLFQTDKVWERYSQLNICNMLKTVYFLKFR